MQQSLVGSERKNRYNKRRFLLNLLDRVDDVFGEEKRKSAREFRAGRRENDCLDTASLIDLIASVFGYASGGFFKVFAAGCVKDGAA